MSKITVVGSGASAVHFALTVLRKGYEVLMLDVGCKQPEVVSPDYTFNDLKAKLPDPIEYFLGENYEAVIYPDFDSEYYGLPPSKNYVFGKAELFKVRCNGFAPIFSFAQGGLAEVWTAGVYPLNDQELIDFPFSYNDLEPYYNEVADRIGISGASDDLVRFYPMHKKLMPPLDLDRHSSVLLSQYKKHNYYLNNTLKVFLGRSRVATLSKDKNNRSACRYSGRCIWGCPSKSLYTPLVTLNECKQYPNFEYIPNMYVSHFEYDSDGHINKVVGESPPGHKSFEFETDKLVLAAGTLSSSKIFMNSIYRNTGKIIKLRGLMDNRQIFVPFVNLQMVGETYNPESYQYHQVAMGIENENAKEYIHGQITTLKTALIHPIIQNIPLDLKTSIFMFRNLHAALGIVNVNLRDIRRENNYLSLENSRQSSQPKLVIRYQSEPNEKALIKRAVRNVKRALWKLGCIAPSKMVHIRPMGASVHYSGTIPMSAEKKLFTTSKYCQSHDFKNLYIVDGCTFPFLPAKNITFTLMANAIRVAEYTF